MKKRLFYITLALVLLVVGINLITRGDYFSGKVKDMIVERVEETLGYEVGMDKLVFNFFPAYLDLERPYIKGWDTDEPSRTAVAESARVYFSISALLSKDVLIRRIQLEEARLHVVRRADGGFNTDDLLKKLAEGSGDRERESGDRFRVEVKEVVLLNSGLRYDDKANNLEIFTDDAGVDLRLVDGGYRLGCSIKDIIAVHRGTPPAQMDLYGDVLYKDGLLELGSLSLRSKGNRVTASGRVMLSDIPELDLRLSARIELGLLAGLAILDGPVTGRIKLDGSVKGTYPDFSGKGSVSLDGLSYKGVSVERLESAISFSDGALLLDGISGEVYGGEVEGTARLDFKSERPRHSANLRFRDVLSGMFTEPDERLRFIPWYLVSGVVNEEGDGLDIGGLRASGSVRLERYDSPHQSPDVSEELAVVKGVEADFTLAGSTIRIVSGSAESKNSSVNFKGTIGMDGESDLVISGRSLDVGDISTIIGYADMDGEADLTATMTGNIIAPVIKGRARISNATAGGVAFPVAFGEVELSGWRLSFTNFIIKPEQGSMNLNGSIYFQGEKARFDEPYFDAALDLDGVDARRITSIFYKDIPVNLTATGDIAFKGNTLDFEGRAHLVTGAGEVYGQKLDKGEVWAELKEDSISFPKVLAVRDRDILTATGRIGFDGTFDAKATSARVDLENFDLLMGTGAPVRGSVSVSATAGGSFADPVITAKISAYTLYLKDVDLGEADLDVEIKGGRLSGIGSLLDDKVTLDGFLELDSPYRWKGRLAFEGGRFEPFVKMVYGDLPEDVSFVSTGELTGHGSIDMPENDAASLFFSDVRAAVLGRELTNIGDIRMSYSAQGLAVDSLQLAGEGIRVKVGGVAKKEEGFNLSVEAGFDMDGLREVFEDKLDFIDGTCELSLKVKGQLEDPVFSGRVSVVGAGVKFRDFQQRFEDVNATVILDGKAFELKEFKAKLGGGTVTAAGRGGLKGVAPDNFSFEIDVQDVRLKYPEELNSTIRAKLYFEGAEEKMSVAGDVFIVKAVYNERIEWKSWLVQFQKKRVAVPDTAPGPFDDVALNIHITGPQNIKIDNNAAKIPVTPDLYVRGTIGRPVLLGRLEADGGQVYFRNNAFTLSSAVVEFADPTRLNPIIDLQAETKVREYTIQLTLSGTLDRIKVLLLSDPPLEEADIITLLTLGRTTEGLAGHEAAITTGEAASFVTGQIQDAVEERVRRLTGFDRFQIDPYLTSTGTSSGPRLTVGKSLFSDKLYITYSSNLGTSEDQFIRLEYLINKNLSLVGERDELGRFGGDIKLRFNFR